VKRKKPRIFPETQSLVHNKNICDEYTVDDLAAQEKNRSPVSLFCKSFKMNFHVFQKAWFFKNKIKKLSFPKKTFMLFFKKLVFFKKKSFICFKKLGLKKKQKKIL